MTKEEIRIEFNKEFDNGSDFVELHTIKEIDEMSNEIVEFTLKMMAKQKDLIK